MPFHGTREITTIFLDDGGVMNDNERRAPEWRRLVAEYFAPRLGGDGAAWTEANRVVIDRLVREMLTPGPGDQDFTQWQNTYELRWVREMAAFVGVNVPTDDADCLKLAGAAEDYITVQVRAAYPGAAEAVHVLHERGFRLFTASAEHSRGLSGYLAGMGIREDFETLYGADLVNFGKYSVEYYRRVFADSGVTPEHALVVDDGPKCLAWARSLGAATCLVSSNPPQNVQADLVIGSLAELPSALVSNT